MDYNKIYWFLTEDEFEELRDNIIGLATSPYTMADFGFFQVDMGDDAVDGYYAPAAMIDPDEMVWLQEFFPDFDTRVVGLSVQNAMIPTV